MVDIFERLIGKSDKSSIIEYSSSVENMTWTQMMNKEMQQIHDSLSSTWRQTVVNHLQHLKSLMPNNQTITKLRQTYEQSIENMNDLQKELMSLWRESTTFVSVDNKTLMTNDSQLAFDYQNLNNENNNIWQTFKTHYNSVTDKMWFMCKQINNNYQSFTNASIGMTDNQIDDWINSIKSINTTNLENKVIEMQQLLNDFWQKLANQIADSFNFKQRYKQFKSID